MLRLEGITKRYGTFTALDAVTLQVPDGSFFGLLGPNGAGKTTLIHILSGYHAATGGRYQLDGRPCDPHRRDLLAGLGFVPQTIALYEEFTAEENLRFFGRLYGLGGEQLGRRIDLLLERTGLIDRRRTTVSTFSGGMKRRLNIAAALLHEPRVLLCDEPTVGVDPQSRNAIFDLLASLNEAGMTILYTTHYMEEVARLCDRVAIMDQGRIIAEGTQRELLRQLPFEEEIVFSEPDTARPLADRLAGEGEWVDRGSDLLFRPRSGFRLSRLFGETEGLGVSNLDIHIRTPTLEALFLHLTGRSFRD
ncbi:MAG: ABC transporter ATP-binding protein [Opitutales bacterium]